MKGQLSSHSAMPDTEAAVAAEEQTVQEPAPEVVQNENQGTADASTSNNDGGHKVPGNSVRPTGVAGGQIHREVKTTSESKQNVTDEKTALKDDSSDPPPAPVWPEPLVEEFDEDDPDGLMNDLTASTDAEIILAMRRSGTLRVLCCTWNMHGEHAPDKENMQRLLSPGMHHIIMITTQECERTANQSVMRPSKAKWEAALRQVFGEEYVMVRSHGLAAIHVSVICHRAVAGFLTFVDSAAVATGLGRRSVAKIKRKKSIAAVANEDAKREAVEAQNTEKGEKQPAVIPSDGGVRLGNKGGVGIAICLGSTSMLFVGAHLAAHQSKCGRRNQDFFDIDYGLLRKLKSIPNNATATQKTSLRASEEFDVVFWGGDFNYRINGNRRAIDALLGHNMHAVMRANDQLAIQMAKGAVFPGFSEGPVNFRPTYKLDPGSNPSTYDTSKKKRIPSWTDRILWRTNKPEKSQVKIIEYQSVTALKMSDHFPVRAGFEVGFLPSPPNLEDNAEHANNLIGEEQLNELTEIREEEPQQVGILDDILGVTRSQVCAIS